MIEAHHHTHGPTEDGRPRGMSQKASDAFAFTLCRKHHSQFHAASGPFKRWDRAERRAWQDKQVAAHRARYLGSEEQYGT
jgi:hypothetical protein